LIGDRSPNPDKHLILLSPNRNAAPFEELRSHIETIPFAPHIQIAPIGDASSLRPRIDFSRDFFGIGGFKTEVLPVCTTPDELALLLPDIPADVIALSGSDSAYSSVIPEVIKVLETRYGTKRPLIIVAGQLDGDSDQLRNLGVFTTIHLRADPITVLTNLADAISARGPASCSTRVASAGQEHDR
jgi:methylmalonyl-CoA mutase cobalamin-binding subunit